MIKIKNILYSTDFSHCANQAFWHALHLARMHKSQIHILHTISLHEHDPLDVVSLVPDIEYVYKKLKNIVIEKMDNLIRSYHAEDVIVIKVERRALAPAPAILDYANENDIDLIVMGTHGRRGIKHILLGSVAEEVTRLTSCPVLTVREQDEPKQHQSINKILVPIDFSDFSQQALLYAKNIAESYNASLQLLHIIELNFYNSPSFYLVNKQALIDLDPDIGYKSQIMLEKLVKGFKIEAEYHVIDGYAPRDIVKFAKDNNIDMIIISSHGLTGMNHFLFGSVTEKVIRRAPCPVFTVKAFGKSLI